MAHNVADAQWSKSKGNGFRVKSNTILRLPGYPWGLRVQCDCGLECFDDGRHQQYPNVVVVYIQLLSMTCTMPSLIH